MKGAEVRDHPHPLASFVVDGFTLLRVHTDTGITGIGEPSPYGGSPNDIIQRVEELKPGLLGTDPSDVTSILVSLPRATGSRELRGRAAAVAGLSHALWDIAGKASGQPVYQLLNPSLTGRIGIEAYASGGMTYEWDDDALLVDEAARMRDAGFRVWKFRPPLPSRASHHERNRVPPAVDVPRLIGILERVRREVAEIDVIVDAGCRLAGQAEATRVANAMADLGCLMLEEPMPRVRDDYVRLRGASRIPIAGGETLTLASQFQAWMDHGAYDVVQPDGNLAGIDEVMKVGVLAESRGVRVVMHNWANDISSAANLHVAAALNACDLVEHNVTLNPFRGRLVDSRISITHGRFAIPDRPGLGVVLNDDVVEHYRV